MKAGVLPVESIRSPAITYLRVVDQKGANRSEEGRVCPLGVADGLYRPGQSRPPTTFCTRTKRVNRLENQKRTSEWI